MLTLSSFSELAHEYAKLDNKDDSPERHLTLSFSAIKQLMLAEHEGFPKASERAAFCGCILVNLAAYIASIGQKLEPALQEGLEVVKDVATGGLCESMSRAAPKN